MYIKSKDYNFKQKNTVPKYIIKEVLKDIKNENNFIFLVEYYKNKENSVLTFEYIKGKVIYFKDYNELISWKEYSYKEKNNDELIIFDDKVKSLLNIPNIKLEDIINQALLMLKTYHTIPTKELTSKDVSLFQQRCLEMQQIGIDYNKTFEKTSFIESKVTEVNKTILDGLNKDYREDFIKALETTTLVNEKKEFIYEMNKYYNKMDNVDFMKINNLAEILINDYKDNKNREQKISKAKKTKGKVIEVDFG